MAEVLFYHLERQPLERVLPVLLEKTLERGWRAVVQTASQEYAEALDGHLWTYREDSFLPHGLASEREAPRNPIVLTPDTTNPNSAQVRFVVEGAALPDASQYTRVVLLFDGGDESAVAAARQSWKSAKAAGHDVTYWQQTETGKWEKKA
ncbi:DNA polymerase III subunit chi [Dichotomicrobium thermohalophilum]|uniref:DNA polymerase III chi subunit n=1 Tax=Dichotomicrobium thermohalophilum TaxID=933063 RepID=A0A397Q6B0_9HYPH|nr:DNA polymerase III subunit chi [Dichotomicrobium thermohalophilum]RIA56622.1 DNA polymerase III chi subunit [Dichotomicrobium thermohalophilum]